MYNSRIIWEKFKFPDEKEEENEEEFDDSETSFKEKGIIFPVLQGNINPFFQPKTFNFWTVHCNFFVTKSIALLVNGILGVESVEVVSPYRMIISIGKTFDEELTRKLINSTILKFVEENEKNRTNKSNTG